MKRKKEGKHAIRVENNGLRRAKSVNFGSWKTKGKREKERIVWHWSWNRENKRRRECGRDRCGNRSTAAKRPFGTKSCVEFFFFINIFLPFWTLFMFKFKISKKLTNYLGYYLFAEKNVNFLCFKYKRGINYSIFDKINLNMIGYCAFKIGLTQRFWCKCFHWYALCNSIYL